VSETGEQTNSVSYERVLGYFKFGNMETNPFDLIAPDTNPCGLNSSAIVVPGRQCDAPFAANAPPTASLPWLNPIPSFPALPYGPFSGFGFHAGPGFSPSSPIPLKQPAFNAYQRPLQQAVAPQAPLYSAYLAFPSAPYSQ
jgi:hypothetical protein